MKHALWLLLVPLAAHAAEHDHSAHTAPTEPVPAEQDHAAHAAEGLVTPEPPAQADHSAHMGTAPSIALERDNSPAMREARHMNMMMHGDSLNYLVLGERLEQTDADTRAWEAQAWLGYDRDKLRLKTEGEYATDADATEHTETQLLYSRAVAPFWDLQTGLRRDDAGSVERTYAVFGVQGLAPYWFEIDAAAFISEQGDASLRLEAEYELRFTQKLLLQPRLELNYGFGEDLALRTGDGLSEAAFGLRLRYELRREFAPYVGLEWARAYGGTADLLRTVGKEQNDTRIVAGLRVWY